MRAWVLLGFVLVVAGFTAPISEYAMFGDARAALDAGRITIEARGTWPFPIAAVVGVFTLAAGATLVAFGSWIECGRS